MSERKHQCGTAKCVDCGDEFDIAGLEFTEQCQWEDLGKAKALLAKYAASNAALVEALGETLTALISYQRYVPDPYKQNPIYIIGAHEAQKKATAALSSAAALRREREKEGTV